MARLAMALLLVALAVSGASAGSSEAETNANPIRKVVTLLQAMQKKVTEEGEKEKELFDKFMCYCKGGQSDLGAAISAAESKVPAVGSDIETSEAKLVQTKEDLKSAQTDRAAAKQAMDEASAIREKEAASFAATKSELDTNIAALNKAVAALEKGMTGGFLQTDAAQLLRRLVAKKSDMIDMDRQELVAFLSGSSGESADYAPQGGEITGIVKEIGDTMQKSLDEATAAEGESVKGFEAMMVAKNKEVEARTGSIESKTKQIGELGVAIVQMKEDLSDTQAALMADKEFLQELDGSCETKGKEWEERSKTRGEELVALADTIKVLNDDDALDLFKKTLPGASSSFIQITSGADRNRARALDVLRAARRGAGKDSVLDLVMLALNGKKGSGQGKGTFDKVLQMIDQMIEVLKTEQLDDENKKEYCNGQFDVADDKKKAIERMLSEEENALEEVTEAVATLTEDIESLEKGINALDKSVVEATEQRKAENIEYKDLMASDSAAKDLLNFAKNRLNKFYNPKMHVAPPKQELSEEDGIAVNMGIAGTGVAVLAQVSAHVAVARKEAPAPPPGTWAAYSSKSEESTGVIGMIDLLIKDLDKEMTEAETEEKNSQADYEKTMVESSAKRAADAKLLAQKGSAKADAEAALEGHKERKADAGKELMATEKYISSLHAECDWLIQYYDVRKEARAGEVDSLQKAKAILSGADYSLLQKSLRGGR
mmetsp:Transcript_98775/g.265350  ORF Transcript_98775/g.265350 Transcript_98775/m.265350 type:complete len:718 (-) Transcript_98775:68-2221(-)